MLKVEYLLSGIDTLVLSLDVFWDSPAFFDSLQGVLEEAKRTKSELPFPLAEQDGQGQIPFMLQPHGSQGFTWLLLGKDYALKIMNWLTPKSRPSIVAELRSELLWRLGPLEAVQRLVGALERQGGRVRAIKPSRADLCMDVLFPCEHWELGFLQNVVTLAAIDAIYREHGEMTGIEFGRGVVSCRLYDKAREIAAKSGKTWFFDLWNLQEVPEGRKVVRIEYQLRREALRELGFNDVMALFQGIEHLWAYCTSKWLKFQSQPGKHHTQRVTLRWWRTVQQSFLGICEGEPLIRAKAIENDKTRLRQQATGLCSSLIALDNDAREHDGRHRIHAEDYPRTMQEAVALLGKTEAELQEDVERKQVKRARLRKKHEKALEQRERMGLVRPNPRRAS